MKGEVLALAELLNVNLELPWNDLPEIFKKQVIYGTGNDKVTWRYTGTHAEQIRFVGQLKERIIF